MIHSFNIKLATNFGIEKAIIIHSLYFWVCKNAANDTHLHDDRYWTYNSAKSLSLLFPYMSAKKIWRVVDDLIKDDILIKGWFNESPFNRTAWHTFSDYGLSVLVDSGYDISNLISKLSTFQKWKFSNSKNGKC